jgi:hypothetical protein
MTNRKNYSQQEARLIARGVLKPPLKKRPARDSWPERPGNVSGEVIEQLWRELCQEDEKSRAVRKMEEGPPEPPCRRRLQTAVSCFSQKLRW